MTARTLVEITASDLQQKAFETGAEIEIDAVESRAYLRIGATTYTCELSEPTC